MNSIKKAIAINMLIMILFYSVVTNIELNEISFFLISVACGMLCVDIKNSDR